MHRLFRQNLVRCAGVDRGSTVGFSPPPCADDDGIDIDAIAINSAKSTADVEYSDEAGNAFCFSIGLIFIEVSVIFLFANCCFGLFRALLDKRSTRDLATTESTHAQ